MPRPLRSVFRLALCLGLVAACDESAPSSPSGGTAVAATPASGGGAKAASDGVGRLDNGVVVGTWKGGKVTYGDLMGDIEGQLITAKIEYLNGVHAVEKQVLESKIMEAILEAEAEARGMKDPDELLTVEIEEKVTPPTEAEAQAHYPLIARQLRGMPYEQAKPQVMADLLRRKQSERFGVYIEELKSKYEVSSTLPFPDLPRIPVSADDDPYIGADNAQITIVQFAEYQCPYCGRANESVEQVMKEYEGKVKMVYRDFPLSFHQRAIPAAVAANCAGEQDKYWEMHEVLMDNQGALEDANLVSYAQGLQLDMGKWNTCRDDPAQVAEVQKDMQDGAKAGVSGTPAFFINGIMLSGAQPFSAFKDIIDRELGEG